MAMFIGSTRTGGHESGCVRFERAGMNQVKPSKQYSSVHPMLCCKNTDLWDAVASREHSTPSASLNSLALFRCSFLCSGICTRDGVHGILGR